VSYKTEKCPYREECVLLWSLNVKEGIAVLEIS